MQDDDLKGCALADVLERLADGNIGHRAAMQWLGTERYDDLVEIMHANGLRMPGHRDMVVTSDTRALLRRIARPPQKLPEV